MFDFKRENYAVVGLGYGDEGKGHIVNWLVRNTFKSAVVRYGGGPQAAHNVVEPDGLHHCFAQFGSGSLMECKTYLCGDMVVDPLAFEYEAEILAPKIKLDPYELVTVDPSLTVVTPYHRMYGQILEISRGKERHSSCGTGFGQTVLWREHGEDFNLTVADLIVGENQTEHKLDTIRNNIIVSSGGILNDCDDREIVRRIIQMNDPDFFHHVMQSLIDAASKMRVENVPTEHLSNVVFEGSQGALLDYKHGFWPHVTKSRIAFPENQVFCWNIHKIGVIRSYQTRHGNGVFVTEDKKLDNVFSELHNSLNEWQGGFRKGWLDFVATRYAIQVAGGVDSLAVTHTDYLKNVDSMRVCLDYWYHGEVDEFFKNNFVYEDSKNGNITVIDIIFENRKLEDRTELAKRLGMCEPRYREMKPTEDILIENIEKELGVKVGLISSGPTHRDIRAIGA